MKRLAPVQAACSHITTMTIDGQNRDLVNYWQNVDVGAGDSLIFRMGWKQTQRYQLNHYYKGVVVKRFSEARSCPQLVPAVFRFTDAGKLLDDLKTEHIAEWVDNNIADPGGKSDDSSTVRLREMETR